MFVEDADTSTKVTDKMLHYEFSSCSKGKQTLGCPYGSTGEWKVYCDNAQVCAHWHSNERMKVPVSKNAETLQRLPDDHRWVRGRPVWSRGALRRPANSPLKSSRSRGHSGKPLGPLS